MPDAKTVDTAISKLDEVDPLFAEMVALLYGDAVDPREAFDIAKMNDASEMHVNTPLRIARAQRKCQKCRGKCMCKVAKRERTTAERERLQARVGLASNVVGLAAGGAALGSAVKDPVLRTKVGGTVRSTKLVSRRTKALAAGALGLQAANFGGDLVANRVLARESKKDIKKALDSIVAARRDGVITTETATQMAAELVAKAGAHTMSRAKLVRRAEMAEEALKAAPRASKAALGVTAVAGLSTGYALGRRAGRKAARKKLAPLGVKLPETGPAPTGKHRVNVEKAELVDYVYTGEISKTDDEKRLVFGWCSLSTVDGEPVVDLQGDYVPIEEIEKSAYAYVIHSRVGGDQHRRNGERPLHTADVVESFIATPDKLEQMGVPGEVAKSLPTGWWIGMRVNDDEQWAKVKSGERAGFSVHGKGARVQKSLEDAV